MVEWGLICKGSTNTEHKPKAAPCYTALEDFSQPQSSAEPFPKHKASAKQKGKSLVSAKEMYSEAQVIKVDLLN